MRNQSRRFCPETLGVPRRARTGRTPEKNRHGHDDPRNGNADKIGEDVDNTGVVADYRGLNEFPAHAHKKCQHGSKPNARVASRDYGKNKQHSHRGYVRHLGQGIGDCLGRTVKSILGGRRPSGARLAAQMLAKARAVKGRTRSMPRIFTATRLRIPPIEPRKRAYMPAALRRGRHRRKGSEILPLCPSPATFAAHAPIEGPQR